MTMQRADPDDMLRQWLRQGDPAGDGREPDATEVASVRRRVLAIADERRPGDFTPSPIWAAAAAVLLAITIGWSLGPSPSSLPIDPRPAASREAYPMLAIPRQRQIQFDTPGGTRVVWVLDPEFEV